MSASCSSRVRFEVSTTSGRRDGGDRPQLGDRDLEVGQQLEQEGLELVVGAVDLVDQQHHRLAGLQRLEQRPAQQEALGVQVGRSAVLGGADGEQLALVVPLVEGLVDVDALVALQADQARAGWRRQSARHLGLAHPGLALEQQRLLEGRGEVHGGGERPVGQVALAGERPLDVVRSPAASNAHGLLERAPA